MYVCVESSSLHSVCRGLNMKFDQKALCKRAAQLELNKQKKFQNNLAAMSVLEPLLLDVYATIHPKPRDYELRKLLVHAFNAMVKDIFGNSNGFPIIEPFGSFTMDLFTGMSDLDLSLNFSNDEALNLPRERKISFLKKFAHALYSFQNKGHVSGVLPVMGARVPIVKVVDCGTGIECDISVENKDGISRSSIFAIVSSIDERFRILSYLMKFWAKVHDINSSKDHTMNSLTIISLVTFHLQTRDPPILPPFSTLFKDGTDIASVQNVAFGLKSFGRRNVESVAGLFVSLLNKLSAVESLWQHGLCASIYEGSWICKKWKSRVGHMSVEDYLDRSENFARAVGKDEMQKIYICIRDSCDYLSSFMYGRLDAFMLKKSLFGSIPMQKPLNQLTNEDKDVKRKYPLHGPAAPPFEDTFTKRKRYTEADGEHLVYVGIIYSPLGHIKPGILGFNISLNCIRIEPEVGGHGELASPPTPSSSIGTSKDSGTVIPDRQNGQLYQTHRTLMLVQPQGLLFLCVSMYRASSANTTVAMMHRAITRGIREQLSGSRACISNELRFYRILPWPWSCSAYLCRVQAPSIQAAIRNEDAVREGKFMKGVRHLCENGITEVPKRYIFPISDRSPKPKIISGDNITLPVIDLSLLQTPNHRFQVLESLSNACKNYGFFRVVNHGMPRELIGRTISAAKRFFELPFEERSKYMLNDIRSPVRYGTSFNQNNDGVFSWRDFLKLNCQPLATSLPHWPSSPVDLREVGVEYAKENKRVFMVIMDGVLESLGLEKKKKDEMKREFEEGTEMMVMNCFPACPEPELTLGMPPHSDYGFLTLLVQDDVEGLQVQCGGQWVTVDPVPDSILVNVGDHLEIFSNGRYKSVLHRVFVNSSKSRISIACLHSLPFEKVISPSPSLINEQTPKLYMDTDFEAFLDYMAISETTNKTFLQSRKLVH
ncbi:hypothetical protein J5N97_023576 [Dioscorea zingiberensis]|uniref:Fe2OG dioxygenase domain-containing protein n=1 Tax=Dioscorea zingiberensis TaxID=325984 RepID=A0A9D5C5Y1_9LILI|nr:hypothetical protein J5N97_023576 [Dioscorea zingiberensis]